MRYGHDFKNVDGGFVDAISGISTRNLKANRFDAVT